MLNIIRDNVQSFGVKFIVAIIAIVMLTFGLSTYQNQGINTLVEVDGYEIKLENYQRAYEQEERNYRKQYQDNADQFIKAFKLKSRVMEQMINNAILLKNAHDNGLEVSDLELAKAIYENPAFQTDNRFDQKKYNLLLKNYRTNKIIYEKELRESLLTQKYLNFLNSGISFSRKYVEAEYQRFNTELDIQMVELTPQLFADEVTVTDEQIQAYYDSNKTNFEQKKQFVINYVQLKAEDVKDKVIVRDKEIDRYYEKNKHSEFSTKESFNSRHILFSVNSKEAADDQKAKKLANRIYGELMKDTTKFAQLAKEHSTDPGSKKAGGNLGWVEKGSFVEAFERTIDSLKKGEISRPVRSEFGYHIIELIDKKAASVKPLEEVKEQIAGIVRMGKAKRRLSNKVAKLLKVEEGQQAVPMADMAKSLNKDVQTTKPFDDRQNLKDLDYSYGLFTSMESKKQGDRGSYQLVGDKGVIIYEITEIVDPFIKPLKDVKNQVQLFAKQQAEKEYAKQKGDDFSRKIKTKEQFTELVATLKAKATEVKFKLSDNNSQVGNMDFKTAVFKMNPGTVKLIPKGQNNVLVFLNTKSISKDAVNENEVKTLEGQLQRQKARIMLNGIISNTRKALEINYNKRLLDALQIESVS